MRRLVAVAGVAGALLAAPAGAGLLDGVGGLLGGRPLVEGRPGAVEGMVRAQGLELLLQSAHMVEQLRAMAAMLAASGYDGAGDLARALDMVRAALDRAEGMGWDVAGADAGHARAYPVALPAGTDTAALAALRAEQARLALEAGRAAKAAEAGAVQALGALPARLAALAAASRAAEGQTGAVQVGTQAALAQAEVAAQQLYAQVAHQRALEAVTDQFAHASVRAEQQRLRDTRCLLVYGGC